MRKQFAVGDYSWKVVSEVIDMVNNNCDLSCEARIPMKIVRGEYGWFIECLNEEDEARLDKHLKFIFGIE